jgi:hypothetical protein
MRDFSESFLEAYLDAAGCGDRQRRRYQLRELEFISSRRSRATHFTILGCRCCRCSRISAPRSARRMTRMYALASWAIPVAHSRSPMLHGYWLRTLGIDGATSSPTSRRRYRTFFRGLGANGFAGGNITKPHKEQAFRLVDRAKTRPTRSAR